MYFWTAMRADRYRVSYLHIHLVYWSVPTKMCCLMCLDLASKSHHEANAHYCQPTGGKSDMGCQTSFKNKWTWGAMRYLFEAMPSMVRGNRNCYKKFSASKRPKKNLKAWSCLLGVMLHCGKTRNHPNLQCLAQPALPSRCPMPGDNEGAMSNGNSGRFRNQFKKRVPHKESLGSAKFPAQRAPMDQSSLQVLFSNVHNFSILDKHSKYFYKSTKKAAGQAKITPVCCSRADLVFHISQEGCDLLCWQRCRKTFAKVFKSHGGNKSLWEKLQAVDARLLDSPFKPFPAAEIISFAAKQQPRSSKT